MEESRRNRWEEQKLKPQAKVKQSTEYPQKGAKTQKRIISHQERRAKGLFAKPGYYNEKSSNILTRIQVLAKTK
jgi:hypothetical protein